MASPNPAPDANASPVGNALRSWRELRRMSQSDLAHETGVSPRHVSFIETGRSRPSRGMVLRLAETLDVPLRDRNAILRTAGFAPAYPEAGLTDAELAPFRQAIDRLLQQQEPFPAMVIDRHWNLVEGNAAAGRLFPEAGTASDTPSDKPVNVVDVLFGNPMYREMIENWDEVARFAILRLRRESAALGGDPVLDAMIARANAAVDPALLTSAPVTPDSPVICPRLNIGGRIISTISTMAEFANAQDVTLNELRVELMFPGDADSEAFFRETAAVG